MGKNEKTIQEVLSAAQRWATSFNDGDAQGCSRMYEEDARMLPAPFDEVRGRDNIRGFWAKMIADGLANVRYLDPLVKIVSEDTAHLSSPWAMNLARGMIHGEVWKRQVDGQWLLSDDHFEVLDQPPAQTGPAEVVLVHGAWMGAWCWGSVTDELDRFGVAATAIDLPGHGARTNDPLPDTLNTYVEHVVGVLENYTAPVVLVGHSFGGVVISQVAEMCPDRLRELVYVSGFMLPNEASFLSATKDAKGSHALDNLEFSDDNTRVGIGAASIHQAVAHDLPKKVFQGAAPSLVLEPTGPLSTPLSITPSRYGRVPRTYIESTDDKALPVDLQRAMREQTPVTRVYSLPSSHVPMLSHPAALAGCLVDIAGA